MSPFPKPPDWIDPNSSLTPAVAGGLTAALSSPIIANFQTLRFPWVALGVSLVFALIIVLGFREITSRTIRFLYCILNALIIFSVAATIQSQIDKPPPPPEPMPKQLKMLACKILDETEMSPNERDFIKNLIFIDAPEPKPGAWKEILTPSQAWAQPDRPPRPPHPAVGPGPRLDSGGQGPPRRPAQPRPSVTPEQLKESEKFQQQRQKNQQQQQRYYNQNNWIGGR
jgi:hypothetical protein